MRISSQDCVFGLSSKDVNLVVKCWMVGLSAHFWRHIHGACIQTLIGLELNGIKSFIVSRGPIVFAQIHELRAGAGHGSLMQPDLCKLCSSCRL